MLLFEGREERDKNYPQTSSSISSVRLKSFFFPPHGQMPYQIGDFSWGPERAEISLFSNDFRGF